MIRSLPPISVGTSLEDRAPSPLPPIGHDISRPSSTSTQSSSVPKHHHHQPHHSSQLQNNGGVNLPSMSSLAGVGSTQSPQLRSFSSVNQGISYATPSPTPTSVGGQGSSPPVCQNCQTSTTPLWRRDEVGSVLCNACGLFLKLHGRPRPISLKTDVIKSRNRVKNSGQALKKAAKALMNGHSRSSHGTPEPAARRVSDRSGCSDRSNSPISRTTTPAVLAPPSIFDPAHIHQHHLAHSPSLPALNFPRHPSPGAVSAAGSDRHLEPPHTFDGLQHENAALKTRVSELEVINGLFKGRIQELERAENNARYALDQSRARELELTKRMGDLERQVAELRRQTPPSSTPASGTKRRLDVEGDLTVHGELSPPYAKRSRLSDVSPASVSPRTTA